MPTNTTPEYKRSEAEYKKARDPHEKLKWLREMLRTVPKHKGTDHLQADIKTRIKDLTEETAIREKKGGGGGVIQAVRSEGAAQIVLIGPPNAGKSLLLNRLTGAHAEVGPYPFTTKTPFPGMLKYEDVHLQLIDLPPISKEFMEGWYANALQTADAAMLVVDVTDPAATDDLPAILSRLHEKKVTLTERWPLDPESAVPVGRDETPDPFRLHLPTILVANKRDLDPDPEEVKVLEELVGVKFPAFTVSAETREGLSELGPFLFKKLGLIRAYTKPPGKPPELTKPYTLRHGGTVHDLAVLVHKEIASMLKFAKLWGSGRFDGQPVGPEHRLVDKDVVELHV
ncbi:MAG: GTPase [Pseudomonadota bacterium]